MLKNYVKIALKVLWRRKFFTFISLVGITSTMVILIVAVTLLDNVFGQSPWETKRSRMLTVYNVMMHRIPGRGAAMLPPGYELLTRKVNIKTLQHIERASIYSLYTPAVSDHRGKRLKLNVRRTDGDYWKIFDFTFLEGRAFTELENLNAHPVAVIDRSTHREFFGVGKAEGKTIEAIGRKFRVVGVVEDPPWHHFEQRADIWIPLTIREDDSWRYDGLLGRCRATVLVKNRSDIPLVKEEFESRIARAKINDPGVRFIEAGLNTIFEETCRRWGRTAESGYGEGRTNYYLAMTILIILGFMLLPTINLVNINVSRILERSPEIGVRKTFGASSRALVGQFLVENILLTIVGGVIGLILSVGVLHLINISGWIPDAGFRVSVRSFVYGILMTLILGVISGVYPAWKMSRLHPVEAIGGGSK